MLLGENENCFNIMQLLLNTLYMISETDKDLDLILSIFKLRLISILGFRPKIDKCISCNEESDKYYFSLRDNGIKCEACSRQDKSSMTMSYSTFNAIKYTITAPSKKIFSFKSFAIANSFKYCCFSPSPQRSNFMFLFFSKPIALIITS